MRLPPGFNQLRYASTVHGHGSFLGVIVKIYDPSRMGGDWVLEFTLQDEFTPGAVSTPATLECRAQRRSREDLPLGGQVGDVAIIRNMRIERRSNKLLAQSSAALNSEIIFFPAASIPTTEQSLGYILGGVSRIPIGGSMSRTKDPSAQEQTAIINLKAAASSVAGNSKSASGSGTSYFAPKRTKKEGLIQDMVIGKYYDLTGEVVKMFWVDSTTVDLYVSDYTENKDLYLYPDPEEESELGMSTQSSWKGPYGQVTIAIRLWEPHASAARSNIHEGDVVFLQNVHTKMSMTNKLEAAIHPDQRFPSKICVHKCTRQDQLAALNQRKSAYEQNRQKRRLALYAPENQPKKPSARAAAKKKEEKRERQRLQKELEQRALQKQVEEEEIIRTDINPHSRLLSDLWSN